VKICPACALPNDERFPTCVACHALLVDVLPTPSANPDDPEHERRALAQKRHAIMRRQLMWAALTYASSITVLAACPGLVLNTWILLLYFAGSLTVAVAVVQKFVGRFFASLLQGLLSVALVVGFGPVQPLIFFMLAGHAILPALLWHWSDLIESANR